MMAKAHALHILGESENPLVRRRMERSTKRLLVKGIRQSGSETFQFTVFGGSENQFPPAEVNMSLPEFRRWIGEDKKEDQGGRQLPLLILHATPTES